MFASDKSPSRKATVEEAATHRLDVQSAGRGPDGTLTLTFADTPANRALTRDVLVAALSGSPLRVQGAPQFAMDLLRRVRSDLEMKPSLAAEIDTVLAGATP